MTRTPNCCCSGFRYLPIIAALLLVGLGWSFLQQKPTAVSMKQSAVAFLKTLDEKQTAIAVMPYDSEKRVDWHFIPKDERKGLQVKHMNEEQRKAAFTLLQAALSESGYKKARNVMELEKVLKALQAEGQGPIRDHERYYFTVFGDPSGDKPWGLSFEGHHLSMNYVVEKDEVRSVTPIFYAANPATVTKDVVPSVKEGTRLLAKEETLAFDLVNSLSKDEQKTAVIAEQAPKEIRGAGEAQPPQDKPAGINVGTLNEKQQLLATELVQTYISNLPEDVAKVELANFATHGLGKVHFAWAGALKPGVGHYYLLEGPSFQIEFVNTQPDSLGNPANHIHCVLRNPSGDFAIPVK